MDSKTIVNDEQNNESKLTQDTNRNVDHRAAELYSNSKSESASEGVTTASAISTTTETTTEATPSITAKDITSATAMAEVKDPSEISSEIGEETSSASKSPVMSLLGLIAITVGLYYGVPFIRDSLKGITYEISELREKSVDLENIDQSEIANNSQLTDSKVITKTESIDQLANIKTLEESVDEALREAVWIDKKALFKYVKSKASKDKKKIRASFTFDGNLYDLMFNFDEDFEIYEANLLEEKFKSFFSKIPSFELN